MIETKEGNFYKWTFDSEEDKEEYILLERLGKQWGLELNSDEFSNRFAKEFEKFIRSLELSKGVLNEEVKSK